MTDAATFRPDWVSPPGETIEDLLEERGWTKAEFAERTAFTPKHVNELLKGRATITADTAERLSRVLGSTARFWLEREAQYQAALSRKRAADQLGAEAGWLKELPVRWMEKAGWIAPHKTPADRVAESLRFFSVASVEAWRTRYEQPLAAFRASQAHEMRTGAVAAWLRQGEREATGVRCAPYDRAGFRKALSALRQHTGAEQLSDFLPDLTATCAAHGVAVVVLPTPRGAPVSGATRWLEPDKALLLLSLRHKTNDHFWFTFFHEAGHILLHEKRQIFVDDDRSERNGREEEADRFARDQLLPAAEAKQLQELVRSRKVSADLIREFAEKVGVAPGVIVGRLQHEGMLPYTHLNGLKVRYEASPPALV